MKIAIFARRGIGVLASLRNKSTSAPRLVRTQITPTIRVVGSVDRAGHGPVVRWRVSPATGRLELHLLDNGDFIRTGTGSFFERLGAVLAIYQRSRPHG
jgi:hypothetical protein